MSIKPPQLQSMSWTTGSTVYELRYEKEVFSLHVAGSRVFAMPMADWKILAHIVDILDSSRTVSDTEKKDISPPAAITETPSQPAVPAKPANMGARWTELHDKELAALWFRGATLQQTAEGIGRTVASVASRLVALDIVEDTEAVYVENHTRKQKKPDRNS